MTTVFEVLMSLLSDLGQFALMMQPNKEYINKVYTDNMLTIDFEDSVIESS